MPLTEIIMLTIAVMHTVHNSLEDVVTFPEIFYPTNSKFYILDAVLLTSNETHSDDCHKNNCFSNAQAFTEMQALCMEIQHELYKQ